jgi:nitronate monooxygenase
MVQRHRSAVGAISDGSSIASALALGADLAYTGTRFVATEEANADQAYKRALTQYAAHDTVYSNLFAGVHGNYLAPSTAAAGLIRTIFRSLTSRR